MCFGVIVLFAYVLGVCLAKPVFRLSWFVSSCYAIYILIVHRYTCVDENPSQLPKKETQQKSTQHM